MDNDISKPCGKQKFFQSFLVAKAKGEICCVTCLSLSNKERTTSSLGKIHFFVVVFLLLIPLKGIYHVSYLTRNVE